MAKSYQIKNGTVVSVDEHIGTRCNCDILVENGIITAIGDDVNPPTDIPIIDATDCILSPGFIDTHRHAWQTQLKNITSDALLPEYFLHIRNVYGSCYTPHDAHLVNSPAHVDSLVEGIRDAGVRATWCYGLYQNQKWTGVTNEMLQDETVPDWRLEDAKRVKDKYFKTTSRESLLRFGFAPAEIERYGVETSIMQLQYGRQLGASLITGHISMGRMDRGVHFVRKLQERNLLGPDLLFSHAESLQDDELQLVRDHGVSLSTTPETELQMAMSPTIASRAVAHKCRVGLGCDVACNNPIDMFQQMRLMLQSQRNDDNLTCDGVPTNISVKAHEILHLATMGGAEAMGLEDVVGSITVGKRADLVLTRCTSMRMTPVHDPVRALVLYANASDVDTVLIDGVVVKRDGRLTGFDWSELRKDVLRSSEEIMQRAKKAPMDEIRTRILNERSAWLDQNLSAVDKARLGAALTV